MSKHFYVVEDPSGVFLVERSAKNGVTHGRFSSGKEARQHATQLRRNYLRPAFDKFGNPLTPPERAVLGVWHRDEYERALARGRAALQVQVSGRVEVRA